LKRKKVGKGPEKRRRLVTSFWWGGEISTLATRRQKMKEKPEPLILGIDLGGTKILTAVVDPAGNMLSRDHSVTPAAKVLKP